MSYVRIPRDEIAPMRGKFRSAVKEAERAMDAADRMLAGEEG